MHCVSWVLSHILGDGAVIGLSVRDVSFYRIFLGKEPYNVYYLLHNGTDSFSCGRTAETACQTLEQVLTLFYNGTSQLVEHGLEIITSKSPLINQQTMASKLH